MCEDFDCKQPQQIDLKIDHIQRRNFIKGLSSLPLAVILADPLLARAAAKKLQTVETVLQNSDTVYASMALPRDKKPAPCLVLIHEWWGLNDQIKAVAHDYQEQGYMVLAVDLFNGKIATTREQALSNIKALQYKTAEETMVKWVDYVRNHQACNGKVATIGWCFGGGWSLNTAIATPLEAAVVYYGNVMRKATDLRHIKGPILGHFGTLDKSIDQKMVGSFQKEAQLAGISDKITIYWYEANHAFANPTSSRFDSDEAKLSSKRTLAFIKKHLS
ncbi:MAG: dienelactone hydrolase family protein [Pseudomonadota bacterium]